MSEQIDAIFDHGVLKPLAPLNLPDKAHVKVTVDPQLKGVARPAVAGRTGGDFDEELEPLLFDGPSLPPEFSRADIYADLD